jgi:UDP-glucose 4-epimerase
MMNVLVTGGAGFIGSHLVETLLARGERVRVLDNLSSGRRANLPAAGVEFIEGDIRDTAAVATAVQGVDAIVHLAAVASVQASVDDPLGTHATNLVGTLNVLEAARHQGVGRIVYASSAAVYGDTAALPVAEDSRLAPLSPYAADKLAGEHYLEFYGRKYGLRGTAFRFFNIYGPRQDPSSPYSGVISIFADRLRAGTPVTIFGDGRQTRDFVYVGDLARVLGSALYNDQAVGQVINVGRGRECSLLELLDAFEQLSGVGIARQHAAARVGDIVRSCADVRRLQSVFGALPATSMIDGLGALLRYGAAAGSPTGAVAGG